jgi:formate transporter
MNDDPSEPAEFLSPQVITFEAIMPADMAIRAEKTGVQRASNDLMTTLVLSVLAGAFISFGAVFATTVSAGQIVITPADGATFSAAMPYGVARLLTGVTFSLGLILVVVAGAELFTGNNLIVMAWASGKVTTRALLRNWAIVFAGNSAGALLTAALMFTTTQYTFGDGAVGLAALKAANAKVAGVCSRLGPRNHVQRAGVSGRLDVLQRANDSGQDLRDCAARFGFRCGGVRA